MAQQFDLKNSTIPPLSEKSLPFFQRQIMARVPADEFKFYIGEQAELKFVNPSEIWFVLMLEKHHINWDYEPVTFVFPNEDSEDSGFTPDIFLPVENLYVELTLKSPKYHVHKKKKMRRLKENYPEIRVSLLGRKNMLSLGEREFSLTRDSLLDWLQAQSA